MRLATPSILSLLLASGPALASGHIPAPATPAPVTVAETWTGAYVGFEHSPFAHLDELQFDRFVADYEGDLSGVYGGIRYDFGSIVAGIEVASTAGHLPRDTVAPMVIVLTSDGPEVRLNRFGAEIGYDLGRVLAYGTAGLASLNQNFVGFGASSADGTFVGLGADFRVNDHLMVGAQWTRYDFEGAMFSFVNYELETLSLGVALTF